jgi:DNA recombination protein RmuC
MQTLASGVGDLKKVMTNIKTRGTWGEVALGALLDQVLTSEQYEKNVKPNPQRDHIVEYAIRLPGGDDSRQAIYLPIDAKFPSEDYQRLVEAQEMADVDRVATATRQLELAIRNSAKDICEKYIAPPYTTDFGVMFLPSEGLYAEVIRRTGLVEYCQRECRVVMAGPTTLAAILNSLQMGFRTLAIQKRSSEVWEVLGAVKTEFGKFGDVLDKVKKKLQEASNTVETAEVRTRAMNRKLREVEELSSQRSSDLLDLADDSSPAQVVDLQTNT